ncbi:MAG: Type 1 glutamine amidotransferase-like domain-containing protein [Pseudomonadota bacterium]
MYSDQVIAENQKVDAVLLDLMAARGRAVGYITSGPEPDRRFFREKEAYYDRLGLSLTVFFDTQRRPQEAELNLLFDCDAIHLPGGDTRAFLKQLRDCDLLAHLADWAKRGGLLIGASAGAIMMTPTVALDAVFTDEDPLAVNSGRSLGLVPFEFFPHLNKSSYYLPKLLSYSERSQNRIAACRDGDGLVINDGQVCCVGDIVWIENGAVVEALAVV